MNFAISDHPEARVEYLAAVAYYDRQRPGLGDEVIDRFEDAIAGIVVDPATWPRLPDSHDEPVLHSRRVQALPYRIVYYIVGEEVRVIAYAHTSREPGYWRHRVDG